MSGTGKNIDTLKRLSRPFWILLVLGGLALVALSVLLIHAQNRNSIDASEHLFETFMDGRLERLDATALEYGYWDSAVENMVETVNPTWISDNLGPYLSDTLGIARVYVIDGENRTTFASRGGEQVLPDPAEDAPVDALEELRGGLGILLDGVRSDLNDTDPIPRSGILMDGEEFHLVSVVRLTTYDADINIATNHALVMTKAVTPAFLRQAGDSYLLGNLSIVPPSGETQEAARAIRTVDGATRGYFSWTPRLPGTEMLPALVLGVITIFACMVLTAIGFTRRAGEVADALEAARQEADRANAAKSDFLNSVTHELRTPINAVIGFSEIMKQEMYGPLGADKYREYVVDIAGAGEHMQGLVDDLLDLAKIEAGEMRFSYEPVSISDVLGEAIALVDGLAKSKGVLIDPPKVENLPVVRSDARAIRQIMVNLLSNAVKFTPPGGHVACEASWRRADGVTLRIQDTGVGIAEDDIPRVLAPFGQVESPDASQAKGTGLGLPITKKIAEALGGKLALASSPGAGTTVTVVLPVEV